MIGIRARRTYASTDLRRVVAQARWALGASDEIRSTMHERWEELELHQKRIAEALGVEAPLDGLRILEIGPGQVADRAAHLAVRNEVTTLDYDVIARGADLRAWYRMLKVNGPGRVAKTVGRRVLVAPRENRAWKDVAGATLPRRVRSLQGDICARPVAGGPFDVVFSCSVFEHLADPRAALRNIVDSLADGGVFYLSIHHWSSISGHHDMRAFTGHLADLPSWGHLRPAQRHLIEPGCYCNEWRLSQWRELFDELAPGAMERLEQYEHPEVYGPLLDDPQLRSDLSDYSDDELLTVNVVYQWRKPARPAG